MTQSEFNAIQVVDTIAAALALPETTKGGARTKFLFSDNPAGGKNSQQDRDSSNVPLNRVTYFERIPQEKCCGTFGTVTTKHSASFGLARVFPGPYPGMGYAGFVAIHTILE